MATEESLRSLCSANMYARVEEEKTVAIKKGDKTSTGKITSFPGGFNEKKSQEDKSIPGKHTDEKEKGHYTWHLRVAQSEPGCKIDSRDVVCRRGRDGKLHRMTREGGN